MLSLRLDSSVRRIVYKNGHPDFAGCPVAMRQAHGLYCGWRGLNTKPAIRLLDRKGPDAEPAIRLSEGTIRYKIRHPDFAGCPIIMQ